MNEIVERVARALVEADGTCVDLARAAIEAMLVPTDEMLTAGSVMAEVCEDGWESNATWRAMIHAALLPDEPKGLPQKLRDFVTDARLAQGDAMERLGHLQHVLADCGLKITEK